MVMCNIGTLEPHIPTPAMLNNKIEMWGSNITIAHSIVMLQFVYIHAYWHC